MRNRGSLWMHTDMRELEGCQIFRRKCCIMSCLSTRESAELDGESRRYQVSVFHDLEPICSLIVLFDFLQMGGCDMPANHVIVME